ncbi:hypothetical protein [Desulfonema magnum]|nr:hypothetical protein [Desulfonema magnum]
MIHLTKSSRIAFEALGNNDKEEFMRLYRHEDDPGAVLDLFKAIKLPDMENIYMLKLG